MWPNTLDYWSYRSPEVPPELIEYTCGKITLDEFLRSGFEVASMFNLASEKYRGKPLSKVDAVLDFGCGCGTIAHGGRRPGESRSCASRRAG